MGDEDQYRKMSIFLSLMWFWLGDRATGIASLDSANLKEAFTPPGCAIKLQPPTDLERVFAFAQIKDELVRGPGVIQDGCVRC